MAAILKSVLYLIGFGGFGYVLMKLTPQNNEVALKKYSEPHNETLRKRQAFVDVLRLAAEGKDPMYRQTKEDIDAKIEASRTKK